MASLESALISAVSAALRSIGNQDDDDDDNESDRFGNVLM